MNFRTARQAPSSSYRGVLCAAQAGQGRRLGAEAENLAAEIDVADVVHPFGAEIDLDERAVLAHADVDDLLGRDARAVDSGLCDIVMKVAFHFKLPPTQIAGARRTPV